MTKLLDEIHPGEILLEEFMKPMRLTARHARAYRGADSPAVQRRSRKAALFHGRHE